MGCGGSNSRNEVKVESVTKMNQNFKSYFILENENQVIYKYIINNKIGEGKYGEIRRIITRSSGEEKAMKIIPKLQSNGASQEQNLQREIDILKTLDHPSIAKMYEFYKDKHNYYIVTEIVKGGDLVDKMIEMTQFQEQHAAIVFKQLISVVQYAHQKYIMHRDIKPDNILLEFNTDNQDSFSIKVVDWGSAVSFEGNNIYQSQEVGDILFQAPEVVLKKYTNLCDIWSCGVILYMMVSGENPFQGKTLEEIACNILKVKYNLTEGIWKNISQECKDLLKNMICPESIRFNAQQVQDHAWMKQQLCKQSRNQVDTEEQKAFRIQQMSSLKKFQTKNQFHQAVLAYIASQLATKEEQAHFKDLFNSVDKNNDGTLSKEEIEKAVKNSTAFQCKDIDFQQIFSNIDVDQNGKVNYSEFILASTELQISKITEKLKRTFAAFDTDGNNYITFDDLKGMLSGNSSKNDQDLLQIISEGDQNSDKKISFEEFKEMMKRYSKKAK